MDVFVCADVEGVSGYVDPEQDADDFAAVRNAMTADVNATIDGIHEAAPDADVVVADSHGSKRTIDADALRDGVDLVRGGPRPLGMVDGGRNADLSCLIGAHDKPGSGGHLEHVFAGSIARIALDDVPVGEVELNSLLLDALGSPVHLVSGDDVLGDTVRERLPHAEYVTAKTARGTAAARCRSPSDVRADLRDAASRAVDAPPATLALDFEFPCNVSVTFASAKLADAAVLWPAVERGDDSRTVQYEASGVEDAYRFCRATTNLSP